MSLLSRLEELTSSKPLINEEEVDEDDDFSALTTSDRLGELGNFEDDEDSEEDLKKASKSQLRTKTAPLLSASDTKYRGEKTSRKLVEEAWSSGEEADEESDEDSDLEGYKKYTQEKSDVPEFGSGSDADGSEAENGGISDEDEEEEVSEEGNDLDEDDEEAEGMEEDDDNDDEEEEEEEDVGGGGGVLSLAPTDSSGDMDKSQAVRGQIGTWEGLLETRINLQQALTLVNQLPQPPSAWASHLDEADEETKDLLRQAQRTMKRLVDCSLELQTCMLLQCPETKSVADGSARVNDAAASRNDSPSDEEIPSDSEEEEAAADGREENGGDAKANGLKRTLSMKELPGALAKRHKAFTSFRDSTLHSCYERTQLTTGKKGFAGFERSPVQQIRERLRNSGELVARTRKRRGGYKPLAALGQDDTEQEEKGGEEDEEVFDDGDWYHSLLKSFIERQASLSTDPTAWTRQYLALQRLRNKEKKVVDRKASKGRKLRYDVHQKLVSFMAPDDRSSWSEKARDELYSSLFGQRHSAANVST